MLPLSKNEKSKILNYSLSNSIRKTAEKFQVSPNTVYLLKKRFIETGQLETEKKTKERKRLISIEGEMFLSATLAHQPDLTLDDLREIYYQAYGIRVSIGTMFYALKRQNLTYKKSRLKTPKNMRSAL